MAVIGIHDYDFFNYEHVIPNIDCAKYITYYRNNRVISALVPQLRPEPYTKFIVRKEYDDGYYPKELFLPNVEYGGRAFSVEQAKPLPPEIEATIPNMHMYDQYALNFGKLKNDQTIFSRILNCAHMRLAPDGQNLMTANDFSPYFHKGITGIFLHDYDLASLKAYDVISEMQSRRKFIYKDEIRPYPVGNKYPIQIYSSDELQNWLKVVTIPNGLLLEYNGLMTDEVLYNLCEQNKRMARQVYYNISSGCTDENDFFIHRLKKIFIQTLFLRKKGIKILLKYKDDFFKTHELKKFIELLNCWLSFNWFEDCMPRYQTLYHLCSKNSTMHYTSWAFNTITVTIEETRQIFQYFRERDYSIFKMFYEWDSVIYEGGRFLNEWDRNS